MKFLTILKFHNPKILSLISFKAGFKLFLSCFLVLMLNVQVQGQSALDMKQIVKEMDAQSENLWVNTYEGIFNDIHQISISMAFNGSDCRGLIHFKSSGVVFELGGEQIESQFYLQEIDQRGITSGYLNLVQDGEGLHGFWMNVDKNLKFDIQTNRSDRPILKDKINASVTKYSTLIDNSYSSILIQQENNTLLGTIYFSSDQKTYILELECKSDDCGSFEAKSHDPKFRFKKITGKRINGKSINLQLQDKNEKKRVFTYLLENSLLLKHYEYANYDSRLEWTYPDYEQYDFKSWMEDKLSEWKKRCTQGIIKKQVSDPGTIAKDRFKYQSTSWIDIHHLSDRFISGLITYQYSWSDEGSSEPFIYDLSKNELVEIERLFKSDFEQDQFFQEFIKKALKEEQSSEDEILNSIISGSDYKHITLVEEGLKISTSFSTIYGTKSIVISFEELHPYFKKSSLTKALIN